MNTALPSLLGTLLAVASTSAVHAQPDISIGSLYDYLPGASSSIVKPIRNSGSSTGFVRVDVRRIQVDDAGNSTETELTAGEGWRDRLIVSPSRLIVPPGGMRSVRVLYVGERSREHVFRVRFTPVEPGRGDGFGQEEDADAAGATTAGVRMLVGYGGIVIVRPEQEQYRTDFVQRTDGLDVINHGNTTLILDNVYACKTDEHCLAPVKKHVLPGRTQFFKREGLSEIRFDVVEGEKVSYKEFRFAS